MDRLLCRRSQQGSVIQIKGVLFRNNQSFSGPPGKPPDDSSYWEMCHTIRQPAGALAKAGIPDVKGVWTHEVGGSRLFIAVSIKQRYLGHARQAGFIASQCQTGAYVGRYRGGVDEDIDPSDLNEVVWAMCTQVILRRTSRSSEGLGRARRTLWSEKATRPATLGRS